MASAEQNPRGGEDQLGIAVATTPETNPSQVGYLAPKGGSGEPVTIPCTEANRHFFYENNQSGRFELSYQGSGEIVDLLSLNKLNQEINPEVFANAAPLERHLAFFDKQGGFHDFVVLKELHLDKRHNGSQVKKHTAIFDAWQDDTGTYEQLEIAVDDIYCISGAIPPSRRET